MLKNPLNIRQSLPKCRQVYMWGKTPTIVIVVCGRITIENTRPLFNHTMNMVHHNTIRPCLLQRIWVQ